MTALSIYQPNFMPQLYIWNRMVNSDIFVFLDDAQHKRHSKQTKTYIMVRDEVVRLTLPIKHGTWPQTLKETCVADDFGWKKKMLKTIKFAYEKQPYYEKYMGFVEESLTHSTVADVNISFTMKVIEDLEIETRTFCSSSIGIGGRATDRLVALCRHFGADKYLCGGTGYGNYMEPGKFEKEGIEVAVQDWKCAYPHGGAAISIVDPLMRVGEETRKWIS